MINTELCTYSADGGKTYCGLGRGSHLYADHFFRQGQSASEFDRVFSELEAPNYPATCDNCGKEGTNQSLKEHICTKETQPMSDTLQEREEDRMITTAICICHKFIRLHDGTCPVHGFVRKQLEDDSGYCPECKGRPRAPWCSLSESDKEVEVKHPDYQKYNSGVFKDYNCSKCGLRLGTRDVSESVCRLCRDTSPHQPAARDGGDEWRYREGSGVIYDAATVPTKIIARYVDADVAQQIILAHDLYQPMLNALKEVEAMLDKELARDYESRSWAKKVRAVLITIEQRSTSA